MDVKRLTVGVVGPSGFGGSHVCVELLQRGHKAVGLSRHPEKIGSHPKYEPRSIDIDHASVTEIADAFGGLDVLINGYGPHSTGPNAMLYMPFLEATRKIILACKTAKVGYLIMIGGCGSLELPGAGKQSAVESKDWWLAYARAMGDSEAHTMYLEKRMGPGPNASALRAYRNARQALHSNRDTSEAREIRESHEHQVLNNGFALPFITACRTSFMFFDGNTSFSWSFISPPALYRSGRRSGSYHTLLDQVPLQGDQSSPKDLDGRLQGISASDLAAAIVDDAETQRFKGKHWTAWGELYDEVPSAPYIDLSYVDKV